MPGVVNSRLIRAHCPSHDLRVSAFPRVTQISYVERLRIGLVATIPHFGLLNLHVELHGHNRVPTSRVLGCVVRVVSVTLMKS